MKPLNNVVVVDPIKEGEQTSGGGIILASKVNPLQKAVVAFVSDNISNAEILQKGDTVLYPTGAGIEYMYEGRNYRLVDLHQIKAVI